MDDELQDSQPPSWGGRFSVGVDAHGRWVVCDRSGVTGGIFADQASALRFARRESGNRPGAICCLPDSTVLDLFAMLKPGAPSFVARPRRSADHGRRCV